MDMQIEQLPHADFWVKSLVLNLNIAKHALEGLCHAERWDYIKSECQKHKWLDGKRLDISQGINQSCGKVSLGKVHACPSNQRCIFAMIHQRRSMFEKAYRLSLCLV